MLRATQAFHTTVDGADRFVAAGEIVPDDDPVAVGRDAFFEPADDAKPAAKKTTGRRS